MLRKVIPTNEHELIKLKMESLTSRLGSIHALYMTTYFRMKAALAEQDYVTASPLRARLCHLADRVGELAIEISDLEEQLLPALGDYIMSRLESVAAKHLNQVH